jgi:hypothetical protein
LQVSRGVNPWYNIFIIFWLSYQGFLIHSFLMSQYAIKQSYMSYPHFSPIFPKGF